MRLFQFDKEEMSLLQMGLLSLQKNDDQLIKIAESLKPLRKRFINEMTARKESSARLLVRLLH